MNTLFIGIGYVLGVVIYNQFIKCYFYGGNDKASLLKLLEQQSDDD